MLHAREDYNRIQDPAANPALIAAYNDAMNVVARGPAQELASTIAWQDLRAVYRTLSVLCRALTPTLGTLINAEGVHIPSHPIADNEPVFLLRASDVHAPATIEWWAQAVYNRGRGNSEMSRAAHEQVERMLEWQKEHGSKVPDLPHQEAGHA